MDGQVFLIASKPDVGGATASVFNHSKSSAAAANSSETPSPSAKPKENISTSPLKLAAKAVSDLGGDPDGAEQLLSVGSGVILVLFAIGLIYYFFQMFDTAESLQNGALNKPCSSTGNML